VLVPSLRTKLLHLIGISSEAEEKRRKRWYENELKKRKLATNSLLKDYKRIQEETRSLLSQTRPRESNPEGKKEQTENEKRGIDTGYYHFDGKGNKIKNKWETFDVDAELEKLDLEEQLKAPFLKRQSELKKLKEEGVKILNELNQIQTKDAEIKMEQNNCINYLEKNLFEKIDCLVEELTEQLYPDRVKQKKICRKSKGTLKQG